MAWILVSRVDVMEGVDEVNGYLVCKYRIDFVVIHNDGLIEYVELKGYPFPLGMLKFKLFEAIYSDKPNVKITMIKQKNNWNMRKLKKVGKWN